MQNAKKINKIVKQLYIIEISYKITIQINKYDLLYI